MTLTLGQLNEICDDKSRQSRRQAYLYRVQHDGARYGMDAPAVLAQVTAQVLHESGAMRYTQEVWGPTRAQRGYQGTLGNTQPGDGRRFSGHGLLQLTGRANHRAYTRWVRENYGGDVDFEAHPQLVRDPAWLGLEVVYFFAVTPGLLDYARAGNIEMVTRRVNGGRNGYEDRLEWYDRTALVVLGHKRDDVSGFQEAAGIKVDGISGPQTRAAMHEALSGGAVARVAPAAPAAHEVPPVPRAAPLQAIFAALAAIFRRRK